MALQGLQVAKDDPEMANLVQSFMTNFLTPQLKNAADQNARRNLVKGDYMNLFSLLLSKLPIYSTNEDVAADVWDTANQIAADKLETKGNFASDGMALSSISLGLTKAVWQTLAVFSEQRNPALKAFHQDSYGVILGDRAPTSKELMEARKAMGYTGSKYTTWSEKGYGERREGIFAERVAEALKYYETPSTLDDYLGEAGIMNAIIASNKGAHAVREFSAKLRAGATKRILSKGVATKEEINQAFAGAEGSEVFDIAYKKGWFTSEERESGIQGALEQFDLNKQLRELLNISSAIADYGRGITHLGNTNTTTRVTIDPITVEVKTDKGTERRNVNASYSTEQSSVPFYPTASDLRYINGQ